MTKTPNPTKYFPLPNTHKYKRVKTSKHPLPRDSIPLLPSRSHKEDMDEYNYYKRCEIPAFGSWDCYDGLPFTQCFDTASRHPAAAAGILGYSYSHDRDLYVAGDLYANDVVTPTMIVVPGRRRTKVRSYDNVLNVKGEARKPKGGKWMEPSVFEEPFSPTTFAPVRPAPKPVDEDLYKIPQELLHAKPKKKRGLRFFSCCSVPTCAF